MTTRHDLSAVGPQGGYIAKQCPVRAQNAVLRPGESLPPPPQLQRLFDRGNDFEAEVITELRALHLEIVEVHGGTPQEKEAATLQAMRAQASLIVGGRLPTDVAGRRMGRPDLLVRAAQGGYRAVDVKMHMALEAFSDKGIPGRVCELAAPAFESASVAADFCARRREDDLLQLAHYQRMLESLGMQAGDGRWAGILGTERRIVWYDLDAPLFRTPSTSQSHKKRSALERYDFEFDFRLDVIAVAQRHLADPSVKPLVVPVRVGECDGCPWWGVCEPQLVARGDVSLLHKIGWNEWRIHRAHGVHNQRDLAALDHRTAALVAQRVDIPALLDALDGLDGAAPLDGSVTLPNRSLAALGDAGIVTVAGALALDRRTAAYSGSGITSLPEQIDTARAALGPAPAYRRRGLTSLDVPRGDVEVDVDMENCDDGCYLWGALLTINEAARAAGIGEDDAPAYIPFATWETVTSEVEAANSLRFWRWLMGLRSRAREAGLRFRAYSWNAPAEKTYLQRLAVAAGLEAEVEEFIRSDDWVDLLRVWNAQLITGGGSGLKVTAPLAGHAWEVDDPGGFESMIKHDIAVAAEDAAQCEAARTWLLAYNRGDVEATLRLREWMQHTPVPAIEELDAQWGAC